MTSIRILKTFLAVAGQGSFAGAAAQVALTQAAVGQQMRALEAELRRPLFERQGKSVVLSEATLKEPKTKTLAKNFADLGFSNALVIGGAEIEKNFGLAARNLREVDVLPVQGINVYDIMRRQKLVLTKAALDALEARFK